MPLIKFMVPVNIGVVGAEAPKIFGTVGASTHDFWQILGHIWMA